MLDRIPSWKEIRLEQAKSDLAPFDCDLILISDRKGNIRQDHWRVDSEYPDGAWYSPYSEADMAAGLLWMPIPSREDPRWLSFEQAVEVSTQPLEPGTALLVQFFKGIDASMVVDTTRWQYAHYNRENHRWYTRNGLGVVRHLVAGAIVTRELPVIHDAAVIRGQPAPLWG